MKKFFALFVLALIAATVSSPVAAQESTPEALQPGTCSVDPVDAATYYARTTGRRVSVEYALIRDVNDQPWRADLLGKKLHAAFGPLVHVNLIPLNPTPGSRWDASPKPVEREFVARVRAQGVTCTVRDTRGREIAAACGQLAAEG